MKDIVFDRVSKSYGKTQVVKELNLTIREGERLILLGPSGCGKSTTLRMIAGLEEITSGDLYMAGERVNDIPSGQRNVSMVFQNYALFPHMTVEDNIIYGLKVHKLPKEEIASRLKTALDILDLNGLAARKPKELSGGQRQRVALARALVKRSDYFLLDEPLSNLDAQLRVHARKELVKVHEIYHQTFIYVTHDQVEAMTVGERIALMYEGNLQMIDTPQNVYNRPANVFTAKFIGSPSTNILEVSYAEGALILARQVLPLPDCWNQIISPLGDGAYLLGIRPENIRLERGHKQGYVCGIVKYVEDYGNKFGVYFEMNGQEVIAICDELPAGPGEQVCFLPDFAKIYLFDKHTEQSIGYPETQAV